MSTILEIAQLSNGDVVLRDSGDDGRPLLKISFSEEVKDMLGSDLMGVAEVMLDAATQYVGESSREHLDDIVPVVH